MKLIKGFWIDGEAVQPLPPDGVEAAVLYPEVKIMTVESYYTKLHQAHKGGPTLSEQEYLSLPLI